MLPLNLWPISKLISTANELWHSIYEVGCYNGRDILLLNMCLDTLNNKGYDVIETSKLNISKRRT
jgi:hypothetical protein